MAKVKITGHASGTGVLTVTAPNTSTDRTITLPDGTGTLIADDGSGNVMVGTTDTVPSNNGASGDAGVAISSDGVFRAARSGNVSLDINRMDSDGEIAHFRKDGVEMGHIGVTSSGAYITLGGTAAANTLDDYEEGTWTPVLNRVGASTITYTSQNGYYTKMGRQVSVNFYIVINAVSVQGSSVNYISGLPFTIGGVAAINHAGSLGLNNGFATAIVQTTMGRGTESAVTFHDNTNANANLAVDWVAGGIISGTLSYFVD